MRRPLPFLALVPLLLAGCGGGGSSSPSSPTPTGRGTAAVSVQWPARARFVPYAANSVVVELTLDGDTVRRTLARDGDAASVGTAAFTDLKYGAYLVRVRAYPNSDGTGVAQATGLGTMAVTENTPGTSAVSLATTVKTVSLLSAGIDKGQTTTLGIAAQDEAGATVLLDAGGLERATWTVGTPSVLGVVGDATGPTLDVKGLHSGTSTVGATLTLGGDVFTATATVTVNVVNDGTGTVTIS